jgi:cation diffusion facilitator family transporter
VQVRTLLKLSIAVAVATIATKSLAWWLTGSVGLLSDAMESFVNLASATFALLMVTISQRPADADHPFGHTKAEYFSSGFEGLLIAGAAVGIIWAALNRFLNPQPLEQLGWGIGLAAPRCSTACWRGACWPRRASTARSRSKPMRATCSPTSGRPAA